MQDRTVEGISRQENVQELMDGMHDFLRSRQEEGDEKVMLPDFLSDVALLTDQDNTEEDDTPKVTLMTIHSSKGLEFNRVYIVGVEEEQFPGAKAEMEGTMEEERRLFYVAVTRAKKTAVLSYCVSRFAMGQQMSCHPSRFITEIDERYIEGNVEGFRRGASDGRAPQTGWGGRPAYGGQSNGYGGQSGARQVYGGYGQPARPQMGGSARPQMGQPAQPRSQYPSYQQPRPQPQPRPTVVDERFRRVGVRRAVEVESEAEVPATSSAVQGAYRVGQRVEHAKFGMGRVAAVEAANGDLKITVDFSNPMVGQKSLLAKFAKLKIVE
jgi:DNA helicase-2/ATP-dependent DNA helicase PcrA